jgi:hypothetical protein
LLSWLAPQAGKLCRQMYANLGQRESHRGSKNSFGQNH